VTIAIPVPPPIATAKRRTIVSGEGEKALRRWVRGCSGAGTEGGGGRMVGGEDGAAIRGILRIIVNIYILLL